MMVQLCEKVVEKIKNELVEEGENAF